MTDDAGPNAKERIEPATASAVGVASTVFISYASQDANIADVVVSELERTGLKCWIAPRDVVPGALYADEIVRAIDEAKVVVLVLSQQAIASSHVGKEVERASSKHRRIVALRTDSAPLTRVFEYFLSESQWIDVGAEGIRSAAAKLAGAIRRYLDPSTATDPAAGVEKSVSTRATPLPRTKWLMIGAVSAVSLALAFFIGQQFWQSRQAKTDQQAASVASDVAAGSAAHNAIAEKSIVVLPFTDMSEKNDQEYFADGMADEIIDLLAEIPVLKVIGRTSSFQFKGKNEDLRKIGSTLGAAYVVEGSVRMSGERVRITAQLINTRTGAHEWSESYDEEMGDVLKMQDRIAIGLVRALQVTIGADDLRAQPTLKSAEAYDLYLRGLHAMDRYDKGGFESAAGYFQQALEIDPNLIRADEWLATAHEWMAEWKFVPAREGYEQARASAERALKLDPRSGLAHSLMCTIHLNQDRDWTAAAKECNRALSLEPRNSHVLGYAGQMHTVLGQWDEAARLTAASIAVDPLDSGWHNLLG